MNHIHKIKTCSSNDPINGLKPRMIIIDEVESGAAMEKRAGLLSESFALKSRITYHETRNMMGRMRDQLFKKIMRAHELERAYRVALIYSRLEPYGA